MPGGADEDWVRWRLALLGPTNEEVDDVDEKGCAVVGAIEPGGGGKWTSGPACLLMPRDMVADEMSDAW
jgi:hypothetical protein